LVRSTDGNLTPKPKHETWELYKRTYPRDNSPYSNLAAWFVIVGKFDKPWEIANGELEVAPDSSGSYTDVAVAHLALGVWMKPRRS